MTQRAATPIDLALVTREHPLGLMGSANDAIDAGSRLLASLAVTGRDSMASLDFAAVDALPSERGKDERWTGSGRPCSCTPIASSAHGEQREPGAAKVG